MKLEITLSGINPLPLNMIYSTSFKTGRRFKSQKYVIYERSINKELLKYKEEINNFNNFFSSDEHYIVADYLFYYPILTKKDKRISKNSGDISNLIKACEDVIFKHLNADDSSVVSINATKIESEHIRMVITYSVKQISQIQ